jgi:hypothetical protein
MRLRATKAEIFQLTTFSFAAEIAKPSPSSSKKAYKNELQIYLQPTELPGKTLGSGSHGRCE